jgi:hypothetical protein
MTAQQLNTQPFLFEIEIHHSFRRNEQTTETFHLTPNLTFADLTQLFQAPQMVQGRQYNLDINTLQVSRNVRNKRVKQPVRSPAMFDEALARMGENAWTDHFVVQVRKDSMGHRILRRLGLGGSDAGQGTSGQQAGDLAGDGGNTQGQSGVQTDNTGGGPQGDGGNIPGTTAPQTSNTGQMDNTSEASDPFSDNNAVSGPSSVAGSGSHPPSIAPNSQGFHPGPVRSSTDTGFMSTGSIRSGVRTAGNH